MAKPIRSPTEITQDTLNIRSTARWTERVFFHTILNGMMCVSQFFFCLLLMLKSFEK